jgi:nucleoside-diphosphate-sugar epimerase
MRHLVTGGSGFIGSYLVRELNEENQDVTVFDVASNGRLAGLEKKVTVINGDLLEMSDIINAIKKQRIYSIFHLAGVMTDVCNANPFRAFRINCEGTANILEAARICDVKTVIYSSSITVVDPKAPEPINEESPRSPLDFYGATKLFGELLGSHYHSTYGISFRALRFTTIYGPGRTSGFFTFASDLIRNPALGKAAEVPFGPEMKGTWLYVKDAVRALALAGGLQNKKHDVFNVVGHVLTLGQVADAVKTIIPDAVIRFSNVVRETPYCGAYDVKRAKTELGWRQEYSIQRGVEDTIRETRSHNRISGSDRS